MNSIIDIIGDKINSMAYVGIGYVIIPSDVNREEYISNCFLNETVSIYPESGGISYNNVKVSVNCLNNIEFPEVNDTFGSCVVYLLHPTQKIPIIVGVISKTDESVTLNYKLFKLSKSLGGNSVTITGDGSNGNLMVSLLSDSADGGQLIIDVNSYSKTGVVKLRVTGNIFIISNNIDIKVRENIKVESNLLTVKSKDIKVESENLLFKNGTVKFHNEIVEVGDKDLEFVALGETLRDEIIKPLISTLKNFSVIVSSFGPTSVVSPETLIKLEQIEIKLQNLVSSKLKVQ